MKKLLLFALMTLAINSHAYNFRFSVPIIIPEEAIFSDWNARTSIQMIEFHTKYILDEKNIIGLKFATWRLFQPMGITWWDGLLSKIDSGSEYYLSLIHI